MRFSRTDYSLYEPAELALSKAVPNLLLRTVVAWVRGYLEEVVVDSSDIAVDGNVVVVKDDEDVGFCRSCVVQALE